MFSMKKNISMIIAIFLLSSALLFAQGGSEGSGVVKAEEPLHLVYSSIQVPSDTMGMAEIVFRDKVAEISGGMLIIDLYQSGQLNNQDNLLPAFMQGKIDMGNMGLGEFDNAKYCSMFKSAYIFSSVDHMKRFYGSADGKLLFDDLAKKINIRMLGAGFYGTRQINAYNLPYEIKTPQDMKKVLLRMPGGADWTALGEALGAKPTPVAFNEVYMALKTGTINAQDNGLATSKAMSFHEVTSQVVMTDHLVWNLHIAINEARWKTLTAQQQTWIQQAADFAHEYMTALTVDQESKLVQWYRDQGIQVTFPDKKAWIDYADNYYKTNKEVTKNWDWNLYNTVKKYTD